MLGPVAGEITFAGWHSGHCVYGAALDGSESAETPVADPPSGGEANFAVAPAGDGGLIAAADDGKQPHRLAPPARRRPEQLPRLGRRAPGRRGHPHPRRGRARRRLRPQRGDPRRTVRPIHLTAGTAAASGPGRRRLARARQRPRPHVGPTGEVAAVSRRDPQDGEPSAGSGSPARQTRAVVHPPDSFATTTSPASRLDVGLASDRGGFALWQDAGGRVRGASLDPIAEYAPPAAPGPPPPPRPPHPAPASPKPATRAVTRTVAVKGGRVTLPARRLTPRRRHVRRDAQVEAPEAQGQPLRKVRRATLYREAAGQDRPQGAVPADPARPRHQRPRLRHPPACPRLHQGQARPQPQEEPVRDVSRLYLKSNFLIPIGFC